MNSISIAMATYNGERYLREQLDSILAQTIPFQEMIICDDASSDGTWGIISEYAEKDDRIKPYRNNQNLGFLKNFERALALCTCDYIALSDQDDIWIPEHLEILLNGIGNKMLVVGDAEIVDTEGRRTGLRLSYCENLDYVPEDDTLKAYFIFFYRNPYQGASMMIRKEFLSKALPLPQAVQFHDVWFSALASVSGGLNVINNPITLYRRHDATVTGDKIRKAKIRTIVSHVLRKQCLLNRQALVSNIRKRAGKGFTMENQTFLEAADKYYKRRKSLFGRVQNFFFELKYYKLIYGCK